MNLARIQSNFEQLAQEDPLWTVLSDNAKRGGKWDPDEFYQTGENEIADLEAKLALHRIPLSGERALDFGCGVGRLTFPLSRRFSCCVGIDISGSMIAYARANSGRGGVTAFHVSSDQGLSMIASGSIDFAFADIVFQHMPTRYARTYLRSLARVLSPGGTLAFQMPSHLDPSYPRNKRAFPLARKRLHYVLKMLGQTLGLGDTRPYFEMHAFRRDRLLAFLDGDCGLDVPIICDYPAAGPAWKSYLYVCRKDAKKRQA